MTDKFFTDTASIAHKMLHTTYAKLDADSRKKVQERAAALMDILMPLNPRSEDGKQCLELIRGSLRQILSDKQTDETGEVDTFDMANAALNIFSMLLT